MGKISKATDFLGFGGTNIDVPDPPPTPETKEVVTARRDERKRLRRRRGFTGTILAGGTLGDVPQQPTTKPTLLG